MIPFNDAYIQGSAGPSCDPRTLRGGTGLSFDGVDSYVSFGGDFSPLGTQSSTEFSVTYCGWFKYDYSQSGCYALGLYNGGANLGKLAFLMFYNTGGIRYNGSSGSFSFTPTGVIPNNELFLLTATYNHNTDTIKIYINDSLIHTDSGGSGYTNPYLCRNQFKFGSTNGTTYKGECYGVQYSKEFLDDAGVTDLYNNYRVLDMSDGGLLLNLEEETGTSVLDASGNDNHGVTVGGVSWVKPTGVYSRADAVGYSDNGRLPYNFIGNSEPNFTFSNNNADFIKDNGVYDWNDGNFYTENKFHKSAVFRFTIEDIGSNSWGMLGFTNIADTGGIYANIDIALYLYTSTTIRLYSNNSVIGTYNRTGNTIFCYYDFETKIATVWTYDNPNTPVLTFNYDVGANYHIKIDARSNLNGISDFYYKEVQSGLTPNDLNTLFTNETKIIPRDESNTDFDVLGNELQYVGQACGANE